MRKRGRVTVTKGMAGAAVRGKAAARRCKKCGLAMGTYPGRYPAVCPTCGGEIEMVESAPVISCVSMVPRLQRILDASTRTAPRGPWASDTFVVDYDEVDRRLPGGLDRLTSFMEGPANDRFYRVESPDDPVLVLELDHTLNRVNLFATTEPRRYLGHDPRTEFVDPAPVAEATVVPFTTTPSGTPISPSVRDKRRLGEKGRSKGQASNYGGFHIHVGSRQTRRPRKDMERALQNKRNQRRGLAKRIKAAKEWHRSPAGERLHKALGRYNERPSGSGGRRRQKARMKESIRRWRPAQHLIEATAQYAETIDDVLDGLLRKLLVIEALDILQDVEFDEDTGSVYLFFDPTVGSDEMGEVMQVLQSEQKDLGLVASPNMSLEGESIPSEWWVAFLPRMQEGDAPPQPDPNVYASPEVESPGPEMRQQIVVPTPASSAEEVADEVDLEGILGDFGGGGPTEALRRLPSRLQERLAQHMQRRARK